MSLRHRGGMPTIRWIVPAKRAGTADHLKRELDRK
jgi:hypothetical protein